jgi:hypothetical protein
VAVAARDRKAGRIPTPPPRARALSRPGPAWNDELATASSSTALESRNAANSTPRPTAARATCAIQVEPAAGIPTSRRTPAAVMPAVSQTTMPIMSHNVVRPNRTLPALSSYPSCAIADDGASTPVARAMLTGRASSTANAAKCSEAGRCRHRGCSSDRRYGAAAEPSSARAGASTARRSLPPIAPLPARCFSLRRRSGDRIRVAVQSPDARFTDLGPDWHDRLAPLRRKRQLIAELERLSGKRSNFKRRPSPELPSISPGSAALRRVLPRDQLRSDFSIQIAPGGRLARLAVLATALATAEVTALVMSAVAAGSVEVPVLDTTGCGDAFDAGFITALLTGCDYEQAAWLAVTCGALVATGLGSVAGLTSLDTALDLLGVTQPNIARRHSRPE